MNIWMDIAIPALVFAAGCLAVAIWALIERGYYKAQNEAMHEEHGGCIIARDSFKIDLEVCQAERDTNKLQAETALAQLDSVATSLTICIRERDALQIKLDEATRLRTRGKAKTLSQERGRDV